MSDPLGDILRQALTARGLSAPPAPPAPAAAPQVLPARETTPSPTSATQRQTTAPQPLRVTFKTLSRFVPKRQLAFLADLCLNGEEREYFREKVAELAATFEAMPHTYQQDGLGEETIVHLHYFAGSADWWITEKDKETADEPGQHQAFGYADLFKDGFSAELGYISLVELADQPQVEIDLHWTPKTLREVKAA